MSDPAPPRWSCVEVEVTGADLDLVTDRLWSWKPLAVEERAGPGDRSTLVAGFARRADATAAAVALQSAGWPGRVVDMTDTGWRDEWRRHARPVDVGDRWRVWPAWLPGSEATVDGGRLVLRIDPGPAFGHGGHPSTQLALLATERWLRRDDAVLDLGCGSGIVASAAAQLGARKVVAVDVDDDAVVATKANAVANRVADRVDARHGSVDVATGRFELVVANIGGPALRELVAAVVARVAPGGCLALGGFLSSSADDTVRAYTDRGLEVVDNLTLDGWAGPILRASRPAARPTPR